MTAAILKLDEKPKVKIDLGCGSNKQKDHIGFDRIAFEGVDHVVDLAREIWPLENASVDEAYSAHFLEHLTAEQRIHFVNELYRVLVSGGKCQLVMPHWSSGRAYGDPTHKWPPVSDFWFQYLNREWRLGSADGVKVKPQAPHTDKAHWSEGFDCDFEAGWGYALNPAMEARPHKEFAVNYYREAIFDIGATLTKTLVRRGPK